MRVPVLLTLAAVLLVGADQKAEKYAEELKKLQGTWKSPLPMPKAKKGKKVPKAVNKLKLVITGTRYILKLGDMAVAEATLTIDPTKKPKRIDLTFTTGQLKGKKRRGIYEVTGDTLKIELGNSTKNRPKKFSARRRPYKRVKE
jgi:uncharacterized protein (TIGR03067 family)